MKTVVAVPYREADERRKELCEFVTSWLTLRHPDWPVLVGGCDDGPFNRGQAINRAAIQTGWDVLVVHDADNIADPETLRAAATQAHATGRVVYPFTTYTYCDEHTSARLMAGAPWFVAPERHPRHGYRTTVRHEHYSGVQAIPRQAWEQVGGFIELVGWGADDAIMDTLFSVYASGSQWLAGGALHLWHPANRNDPKDTNNVRNHRVWNEVLRRRRDPGSLRTFLASIGHTVP